MFQDHKKSVLQVIAFKNIVNCSNWGKITTVTLLTTCTWKAFLSHSIIKSQTNKFKGQNTTVRCMEVWCLHLTKYHSFMSQLYLESVFKSHLNSLMRSQTGENHKDWQNRNARNEGKSWFLPKANADISSFFVSSWHGDRPSHNTCGQRSKSRASSLSSGGIQWRKYGWRKQNCFPLSPP